MFKIIFNLIIAFLVAIFILETTFVIRPFSESLIHSGVLPPVEAGSSAPGILEVIAMVLQGILVAIEPVFVVLMDIIYLAINTILSIQITMSGLIYSLIILFIISSLYEKYRNIILKLNKLKNETENNISKVDLARTLDESERHLKKLITREETKKNSDLLEQATAIKELLLKINSSIDTEDNIMSARTKKERRTQKTKPSPPKTKTLPTDEESVNLLEDENISKVDLARALIESNDLEKARELLIKTAETGTETEIHEAKLLYLQLK